MLMLGTWYVTLLAILFIVVCLFMMLVILIQKPRGGGLSGAFGGGGGSAQAVFGAKTGDVLTWFTVFCFTAFLLLAIGLTWLIQPVNDFDAPTLGPVDASDQAPSETDADTGALIDTGDPMLPQEILDPTVMSDTPPVVETDP